MDNFKVKNMLNLFFTFHDVDGKDSVYIEESLYDDKFFRWKKDTFKSGKDLTCIYNKNRIILFDTIKVKERLASNLDEIKNNPSKTLFGVHPNIVKDLVYEVTVEEFTEKDKLELARDMEIQQFNKAKRKAYYEKNHCSCEKPNYRTNVNRNGSSTYCITCNKMK